MMKKDLEEELKKGLQDSFANNGNNKDKEEMLSGGETKSKPNLSKDDSIDPNSEFEKLKGNYNKLKIDFDKLKDQYLRVNAEFVNFKNRVERDRIDLVKYSNHRILEKLLPCLDSFDKAIDSTKDEGLKLLHKSLMKILMTEGLERVSVYGKQFDPNIHEAVCFDENVDIEDNVITAEMQAGYKLGNKILRHSMVKVNRRKNG